MDHDAMAWVDHVIWWQVYPLGFVGAPLRDGLGAHRLDSTPGDHPQPGTAAQPVHRLGRITAWLDHLVELGANGLLLGPVFASATHGYDTLDHFRVDPRLGDQGDLDELIAAAHARGVRVAFDGVFNHVADTHPRYLQALADGPGSAAAAWFRIDWEAPGDPRPQVFEGHSALVAFNHQSPQVRDYVTEVLNHWTARGVDAWRLDAAYAVSPSFWADVLPRVRRIHPGTWFTGEVIHGDLPAFIAASSVDSVTQYPLWKAIWSSVVDRNFFELDWALARHAELFDTVVPSTFVGNHDVTRIATRVGAEGAALAATVLATVGGVPSIYAGDELGWTGLKEEREGGDDAVRPPFPDSPTLGAGEPVFRWHQGLLALRRRHPWLVTARTQAVDLTNTRYVYRTTSADGAESLIVELDLIGGPRAQVRAVDGTVLVSTG